MVRIFRKQGILRLYPNKVGGRGGDFHFLCGRVLHLSTFPRLPKTPKILHGLWRGPSFPVYHPVHFRSLMGPVHVDRSPQLSRRPARVLCRITGRVVRHHRIGCHRRGKYSRRRASREHRLSWGRSIRKAHTSVGSDRYTDVSSFGIHDGVSSLFRHLYTWPPVVRRTRFVSFSW